MHRTISGDLQDQEEMDRALAGAGEEAIFQRSHGLFGNQVDSFSEEPANAQQPQMTSQRPLQFSESQPESPPNSSAFLTDTAFFPTTAPGSNTNNNAFAEFNFEREGSPEEFYNPYEDTEPDIRRSWRFPVSSDRTQFPYDHSYGDTQNPSSSTAADQLFQEVFVKGGADSLARNPSFDSVTKKEMAADEMEGTAQDVVMERSKKKRRPVPAPPTAPAAAAQHTGPPDPAVRRKKRPIPTTACQKKSDADSAV